MSKEEIEKFEHAYNYWITDKLDDGTFSVLVYNFISNTKQLIEEIADYKERVKYAENGHDLCYKELEELRAEVSKLKASKSEANEAVLFAEWLNEKYVKFKNGYMEYDTDSTDLYSLNQLYDIWKRL